MSDSCPCLIFYKVHGSSTFYLIQLSTIFSTKFGLVVYQALLIYKDKQCNKKLDLETKNQKKIILNKHLAH